MFHEKRRTAREKVNLPGTVVFGAMRVDCIIDDISEGGVRLVVKTELPNEFFLVTKDRIESSRRCRLVWRLDDEVGAEFI